MSLKAINVEQLLQLTSVYVDDITCIECCKYYTVPSTAICGHSLCHSCWRTRRTCPCCGYHIDKRTLMLNLPLQNHKENVTNFIKTLEELFNIKFDYLNNLPVEEGSNKNVKAWLTNFENHFSAPVTEYQESFASPQDLSCLVDPIQSVEQITSEIQIHSEKKKMVTPKNIIHVPPLQDDWDKIEELPQIEKNCEKLKENCESSLSSFGFLNDENLFPSHNLRTSQKKENVTDNNQVEKSSKKNRTKASNTSTQNNPSKITKNWNNVKRMKKEFSKLNKKNRNKLNISIEKYKKSQINKQINKLYEKDNTNNELVKINVMPKNSIETEINDENDGDVPFKPENVIHAKLHTSSKELTNANTSKVQTSEKEHHISDEPNINQLSNSYYKDIGHPNVNFFQKGPLSKYSSISDKISEAHLKQHKTSKIITNTNDDVEITIRVGTTLTNICIKKKENDVQVQINSDKEIQTSCNHLNIEKKATSCVFDLCNETNNNVNNLKNKDVIKINSTMTQIIEKSTPSKKNTASADTTTIQNEITESIEKELANTENAHFGMHPTLYQTASQLLNNPKDINIKNNTQTTSKNVDYIADNEESLNIYDIFDGESVKEANVHTLKSIKNTPSEILMPSTKTSATKVQKDKRERNSVDTEDFPLSKKRKILEEKENDRTSSQSSTEPKLQKNKRVNNVTVMESDSESINYDALMSQVFANIDADMGKSAPTQPTIVSEKNKINSSKNMGILHSKKDTTNDKCSENIFSLSKASQDSEIFGTTNLKTYDDNTKTQTKKQNEEMEITKKLNKINKEGDKLLSAASDLDVIEISTPEHDDDSDKSVVEDTPQKNQSFTKSKYKIYTQNTQQLTAKVSKPISRIIDKDGSNIVSLLDTLEESSKQNENTTVIETKKKTMDTPLTITNFVGHIKYKSTPVARKSLNFNTTKDDNIEITEQTLCPSSFIAAETTQEKDFLSKAFDQTLYSPSQNVNRKMAAKFCVAGSCLTGPEQAKLKLLCSQRNWTYVEKYSKDLTHLVVGVDEENKSQRSVKYMCALAGAKWIISYAWVEKCLQTKSIIDEEAFEALDGTGEPGPRRSRIAKQKIFQGIMFYCMPPFSVLDVDTLKDILRSAGGLVVEDPEKVQVTKDGTRPAILLAEPENTQEDRFVYLAIKLNVVPVNYEWVLNCLGSYTLGSIHELLLCPATLLPKATEKWPSELMSRDFY